MMIGARSGGGVGSGEDTESAGRHDLEHQLQQAILQQKRTLPPGFVNQEQISSLVLPRPPACGRVCVSYVAS